jgi:hypothetical protein
MVSVTLREMVCNSVAMRVDVIRTFLWVIACMLVVQFGCRQPVLRIQGNIDQEVYIWQRAWDGAVQEAMSEASPRPAGAVVLAAEVSFDDGQPSVVRISVDYEALKQLGMPVGLALRIGPYPGPFSATDDVTSMLSGLAAELVARSEEAGLAVNELQIDFDCAESKLGGYCVWAQALRRAVEPVPLILTALPSWLRHREFGRLAATADGYVLQVHSLEAPRSIDDEFTLCDRERSLDWIEQAARLRLPFRVALPTYGYLVAFDCDGGFIGLSAEGPLPAWPEDTQLREIRSDPVEMADLVAALTRDRPENLVGLIWYRMPVAGDRLNWPWPTLRAVMEGRHPFSSLRAEAVRSQSGLVDIELVNDGELAEIPDVLVSINWAESRLLAYDVLNRFVLASEGPVVADGSYRLELLGPSGPMQDRLGPGERRLVAWLRFERETEVSVDVSQVPH